MINQFRNSKMIHEERKVERQPKHRDNNKAQVEAERRQNKQRKWCADIYIPKIWNSIKINISAIFGYR